MPDPEDRKVLVFEVVSAAAPGAGVSDRPLLARGISDRAVQVVETSVGALKSSMEDVLACLNEMFVNAEAKVGTFAVDTVEVQCQITGSGKIGFAGTGVDLSGGSSLKVVLKRKT